jgi:hypothetical protein
MRNARATLFSAGLMVVLLAGPQVLAHPDSDGQAPPDSLAVTTVIKTGSGENTYQSVANWCQIPEGRTNLGSTHGGVVVDKQGLIYFSMEQGPHGILVYSADGKLVRGMADKYLGIHGLCINDENGEQFIYAAHLAGREALKLKLDGTVVWTIPVPMESGKYKKPEEYHPTAITVAPNGHVYIADGYGQNWVHEYDENQKYVRSFGGKGKEPGQFQTCHGIALDTRGPKPLLLVCDRENRRLQHFDLEGKFVAVIAENLRRPCSVSFHGDKVAVAELEGRVSILDGSNKLIATLGDNPDHKQWATNKVPPAEWKEGIINAAHGISFDKDANLYIEDWNVSGRIIKMEHIAAEARAD